VKKLPAAGIENKNSAPGKIRKDSAWYLLLNEERELVKVF
jgi:hypothetical protein